MSEPLLAEADWQTNEGIAQAVNALAERVAALEGRSPFREIQNMGCHDVDEFYGAPEDGEVPEEWPSRFYRDECHKLRAEVERLRTVPPVAGEWVSIPPEEYARLKQDADNWALVLRMEKHSGLCRGSNYRGMRGRSGMQAWRVWIDGGELHLAHTPDDALRAALGEGNE